MEQEVERVCSECSKVFKTTEEEATLCSECWERLIGENEGE
jgi:hypothetical protein